ncbi:MAG: hypothetical protein JWQ81_1930 [Amycolatopsis sp.]|uniref:hypothetical protein n=1 Tax=Amycolatopsis sp. TaxID=37632 RepID=UPI0026118944|nr:hypothetical protein [Amycolatopsis sp.]MCU1681191.1 hypothetical protein [Amycolatopsis sp.]
MSTTTNTLLKPVITVLYLNLAISFVLAALTFLLKNNILDYQVANLPGIGTMTPADAASSRRTLADILWIRPISVLLISVIYVRLASRLHLGRRRTYIRVLVIAVAGFLALAYLVASAQFPMWMRVGQVVQALVLLGLLFAVTRRDVRNHFSSGKPAPTTV